MQLLPIYILLPPLVLGCPLPLTSGVSCPSQLIQFYAKFFRNSGEASESFVRSIPSDILPLSGPMKVTNSPLLFPIINSIDYCNSDSVMTFPFASYSLKCYFDHAAGQCFCDLAAPTDFEFIAISPSAVKVELADYISTLDSFRKLELSQIIPRNESGTASQDRFDIGVVTHAILVILSFISFAGNALFVVYVFWLSR